MNPSHRHHLLSTLRHVDELLAEMSVIARGASANALFKRYVSDLTPVRVKALEDAIERTRALVGRGVTQFELAVTEPVCTASWAAQSRVSSAYISVAEIDPRRMVGYGPLSQDDVAALERFAAQMSRALFDVRLVAEDSFVDVKTTIAEIERTEGDLPLLRELARIIEERVLSHLRQPLAVLLDRARHTTFEVAVFGRTNCGKSSLLNRLLGRAVLPVGAIPVTTIPIRIRFGTTERCLVEFAARETIDVDPGRLPEFSTEQFNPGNAKHVGRILVELPSTLLQRVSFVDTPGIGALEKYGASEAIAYLPRCDLGIVMVDAAASLEDEELDLVRMLRDAGSEAMVLIGKADLLSMQERDDLVRYVGERFVARTGASPAIHLMSVARADAALCDRWRSTVLQPLLLHHRLLASRATRRKIGLLKEAVTAALEGRLRPGRGGKQSHREPVLFDVAQVTSLAAAAERDALHLIDEATLTWDEKLVPNIAAALADDVKKGRTVDLAAVCLAAVDREVHVSVTGLLLRIDEFRTRLQGILVACRDTLRVRDGEHMPRPDPAPLFDGVPTTRGLTRLPWGYAMLPSSTLQRLVAKRLRRVWGGRLESSLTQFRQDLVYWAQAAIAGHVSDFHALVDPLVARLDESAYANYLLDISRDVVEADLTRLRSVADEDAKVVAWPDAAAD